MFIPEVSAEEPCHALHITVEVAVDDSTLSVSRFGVLVRGTHHLREIDECEGPCGLVEDQVELVEVAVDQTVTCQIHDHVHHPIIQLFVIAKEWSHNFRMVIFRELIEGKTLRQ